MSIVIDNKQQFSNKQNHLKATAQLKIKAARSGTIALALLPLAACGGGGGSGPTTSPPPPPPPPPPEPDFTEGPAGTFTARDDNDRTLDEGSATADLIVLGKGGDDTITTGSGADMIWGGEGSDTIIAGDGDDVIVVVGTTSAAQYSDAAITDPAGSGVDLSALVTLADLNDRAVSEIAAGESIDGGAGSNTLFIYGTVDLTGATLTNLTHLIVNSDVTLTAEQIAQFTTIDGDGNSVINIVVPEGAEGIVLDLSAIEMSDIAAINIVGNLTILVNSLEDISGITSINTNAGDILKLKISSDGNPLSIDLADITAKFEHLNSIDIGADVTLNITAADQVSSLGLMEITGPGEIIVAEGINSNPVIGSSIFSLTEGASNVLNFNDFNIFDVDDNDASLTIKVENVQQGHFEISASIVTEFTLQNVADGLVSFVHNGSETAPEFDLSVKNDEADSAFSTPVSASVDFIPVNDAPVIGMPTFEFNEGRTTVLTVASFDITDVDDDDAVLSVQVSNIDYGHFERAGNTVTEFTLQDVTGGLVSFVHTGGDSAPAFDFAVKDDEAGAVYGPAASTEINFHQALWNFDYGIGYSSLSSSEKEQLESHLDAAMWHWMRYFDDIAEGADLTIKVNITTLASGVLAEAGPDVLYYVTTENDKNIYETNVESELHTGNDGNGWTYDGIINIDPFLLNSGRFEDNPYEPVDFTSSQSYDVLSVLIHEVAHILGWISLGGTADEVRSSPDISTYDATLDITEGVASYAGDVVMSLYDNQIILDNDDINHLPSDIDSQLPGYGTDVMLAFIDTGERQTLSRLDLAILQDIGYSLLGTTSGNDTLYGFSFWDDVINLGDGDDLFYGFSGDDTISGGQGDDILQGGIGADILNGGSGYDTLSYEASRNGVTVNLLTSTVSGGDADGDQISGFENVIGSREDDTITGDGGNNSLQGRAGVDHLIGGDGNDILDGGYTNTDSRELDWLEGGNGDDILRNGGRIFGGNGNDTIEYYSNSWEGQEYHGGDGIDTFVLVNGGKIDLETMIVSSSNSAHSGTLSGFEFYRGGGGTDIFHGSSADETFDAGTGYDIVQGRGGADTLNGGGDRDTVSYVDSPSAVNVNILTNEVSGGDAEGDVLSNFENLFGSAFDDILTGTDEYNDIQGGAGNDTIIGGGNSSDVYFDTLRGQEGDDTLITSSGREQLFGGNGYDTVDYHNSDTGVHIDLESNLVYGGYAQGDTINSIEAVTGSEFDDYLRGNDNNNILEGLAGDDTFIVSAGSDIISGGEGFDTVDYADFDTGITVDLLQGTATDGGPKNDSLSSIEGVVGTRFDDLFVMNGTANTVDGKSGFDEVSYAQSDSGVQINLDSETAEGGYATGDMLRNVENVTGSAFDDVLIGTGLEKGEVIFTQLSDMDLIPQSIGIKEYFENYIPLDDGRYILIWSRETVEDGSIETVAQIHTDNHQTIGPILTLPINSLETEIRELPDGNLLVLQYSTGNNPGHVTLSTITKEGDMVGNSSSFEHKNGHALLELLPDGKYMVGTWIGVREETGSVLQPWVTTYHFEIQIYDASGQPVGDVILLWGPQDFVSFGGFEIVVYEDGSFLAVQDSLSSINTKAQLFDSQGLPLADPFIVIGPNGEVVSFHTVTPDGEIIAVDIQTDIFYWYDKNGNFTGREYQVDLEGFDAFDANLVFMGNGNMLITATHYRQDSGGDRFPEIVAFLLDPTGVQIGSEFILERRFFNGPERRFVTDNESFFISSENSGYPTFEFSIDTKILNVLNEIKNPIINSNILSGGAGNDYIEGRGGSDALYGGAGDDVILGGKGADTIDGGSGIDTASYADSAGGVMVDLLTGSHYGGNAEGDIISNVENIYGSMFDDVLRGDDGNNILTGDGGNDILDGRGGNDTLIGWYGDDILIGGAGADSFEGGVGNDTIIISTLDFLSIDGGDGVDSLVLDGTGMTLDLSTPIGDLITGIEEIDLTGSGDNSLILTAADLLDLSDTSDQLMVLGDAGDSLTSIAQGWAQGVDQVVEGETYNVYTSGDATLLVDTDITQDIT